MIENSMHSAKYKAYKGNSHLSSNSNIIIYLKNIYSIYNKIKLQ